MEAFHQLLKKKLESCIAAQENIKPFIPKAHSVYLKESYERRSPSGSYSVQCLHMEHLLRLKVVGILMGMQGGFTKYCCFLCLWNSLATKEHYIRRDCPERKSCLTGVANIEKVPLVDTQNIFLPPFHVKLGIIKKFVKAMGKSNFNGFAFLCKKFFSIRQAKLKEGIFVGS